MNEIDISKKNVIMDNDEVRKCDYKCSFSYQYPETNVVAVNSGDFLTLTCENYSNRPVKFNGKDYNVNSIMIFSPSLHLFRGKKTAGEMIIEHTPSSGGMSLYVCLPITESYNSNAALAQILNEISLKANEKGGSLNFNKTDFTLQNIVPRKPFYYYQGTFANSEGHFIVYDVGNGITLDASSLKNIKSSVVASSMQMFGGELSYNPKGPFIKTSNDMYISCRPVGSSSETVAVQNQKGGTTSSSSSSASSSKVDWALIIMMAGVIIIVGVLLFGFGSLLGKRSNITSTIMNKLVPVTSIA